jgi:hypothetical protein
MTQNKKLSPLRFGFILFTVVRSAHPVNDSERNGGSGTVMFGRKFIFFDFVDSANNDGNLTLNFQFGTTN